MTSLEPIIGSTVGNYRIEELLGAGAMGQVFLGVHPQIGRKVAVKVLHAHYSANADTAARFLAEARAVNSIEHPRVVQVFDFGQLSDGRLYLIMEYLAGRTLAARMRERPRMSLRETLDIVGPVAAGLDAAHAAGVVHRDLKPDNIFLAETKNGLQVKIVDFGIAKVLEPELRAGERTATGLIMGTPAYMSPEQAAGDVHRIGPASDVYALAVIVYRMLSGRLPFEADFIPQLLVKHVDEPPTPITRHLSGFPEEIWRVLEKAMAKSPDDRFASAGELVRALEEAARRLETNRTLSPFETREAISFHVLRPAGEAAVRPRSRPYLWAALGLAALAGATAIYFIVFRGSRPPAWAVWNPYPHASPAAPVSGRADGIPPMAGSETDAGVSVKPSGADSAIPVREHRLRVETDSPGVPLVVDVDGRRMEGISPLELAVPDGAAVRIAPSDARHAGMARELVVTADVVVVLSAVPVEAMAPETAGGGHSTRPAVGMAPAGGGMSATGAPMDVRPPGEDDTVPPMF